MSTATATRSVMEIVVALYMADAVATATHGAMATGFSSIDLDNDSVYVNVAN